MRILLLADDSYVNIPTDPVDAIFALGDLHYPVLQRVHFLFPNTLKLAVPGNHDSKVYAPEGWIPLHGTTYDLNGYKIGGLGGCIPYKSCPWVFFDDEAEAVLTSLGKCDIILSHNSPQGIHDRTDDVHDGFPCLRNYILKNTPRLVLHGHQHVQKSTQLGVTTVRGVYGAEYLVL